MLGWIRTTRGVKTFLCTIGFWALGLGLVLVVEGHAPAGGVLAASGAGVLWAVGYWVQPWGEPGWYPRVLRAWNDWSGSVKVAQGTAQPRAAEIAARVEALPVPRRFAAEGQPIVALFKTDALSMPAESGVARLEAEALSPEERAYAQALRNALDDRLEGTARMYEQSREACERFVRFLTETRAPARRADLQSQMRSAVEGYAHVMETARTAAAAHDFEALANLGDAGTAMRECGEELRAANPMRRAALRASSSS